MDIIHLLPDSVANQIAAGEVVQRPASVVKELMENAIDAGATNVSVLVEDAGRTSIQVIDDGKGMSETDARMAFERHATSKILQAEDLFSLHTMGFRGEALPSIAAVSQVRLQTRTTSQELGTNLCIDGSKVISQEPCACPVGANFEVRNLFFNVPARRKFLKSNQTEMNNIIQEFERIVLVNPTVAFSLSHNGNVLLQLPASGLRQRVANVLGKKLSDSLLDLEVSTSLLRLSGFVGRPETARKKGVRQFLFVNGRFMRHPYFHRAVMEAYEHLLPEGEQVPYLLSMQVDPASIDVNIHPTKTEIKFENEMAIWQIIVATVRETLGRFNAVPTIEFDTEGRPEIPVFNPENIASVQSPRIHVNAEYNPFHPNRTERKTTEWEKLYEGIEPKTDSSPSSTLPFEREPVTESDSLCPPEDISTTHMQLHGQYILTAVRSGLMMIDQHRAHTRILYERYLRQAESQQPSTQGLLFPEMLQLTASEAATLEASSEVFRALGFDLSPLGGGSYSLLGVPGGLDGADPSILLHDMITDIQEGLRTPGMDTTGHGSVNTVSHRAALSMARHTAIPVGQSLSPEEMESLVGDLFHCQMPSLTPTGKPILTILTAEEIRERYRV